jgi:hypothetical protein
VASRIVALETDGFFLLRRRTTSRYAFGPKTAIRMLLVAGNGRRPMGRRPVAHDVGISVVTLTGTASPGATVAGAEMRTHSFASATAGTVRAVAIAATARIGSDGAFTLELHHSTAQRSTSFRQSLLAESGRFGQRSGDA